MSSNGPGGGVGGAGGVMGTIAGESVVYEGDDIQIYQPQNSTFKDRIRINQAT